MLATATSKYLPARAGDSLSVLGDSITIKLTGADTDGAYMMFEAGGAPGHGIPTHTHRREDETFYVLEGAIEARVGDATLTAQAGATIFLPRDVPHSWRVVGERPARALVIASPAGFEHYFAEMSRLPQSAPPDMRQVCELSERYGIEFHPNGD